MQGLAAAAGALAARGHVEQQQVSHAGGVGFGAQGAAAAAACRRYADVKRLCDGELGGLARAGGDVEERAAAGASEGREAKQEQGQEGVERMGEEEGGRARAVGPAPHVCGGGSGDWGGERRSVGPGRAGGRRGGREGCAATGWETARSREGGEKLKLDSQLAKKERIDCVRVEEMRPCWGAEKKKCSKVLGSGQVDQQPPDGGTLSARKWRGERERREDGPPHGDAALAALWLSNDV